MTHTIMCIGGLIVGFVAGMLYTNDRWGLKWKYKKREIKNYIETRDLFEMFLTSRYKRAEQRLKEANNADSTQGTGD